MSRAAVRARDVARRRARSVALVDAEFARADAFALLDACLVACEGCGLVQASPPSPVSIWPGADPAGTNCVVCGCRTATFVEAVPGSWGT